MPHNINSMAYYGDPPWHGLGRSVPKRATAAEMIVAAGLDWRVEKQAVPGARCDDWGRPVKYQLVRKGRSPSESDVLLGLVSPRYEPLQNVEAFEFFDPIVGKNSAIFETAGALGDGERVWVLAKLPGYIRVAGDDIVDKFVLLSNAHTGEESVTVKFTPIRVVCQNTLIMAMRDGQRSVKVRHTRSMPDRLAEVPEILGIYTDVFQYAGELFQRLARVRIRERQLLSYLSAVAPQTDRQREENKLPTLWREVLDIFYSPRMEPPEIRGTLWAAYNAVTYFEDYRESREGGADRRLNRTWFGEGADLKFRALDKAKELAAVWSN